MEIKSIKPGTVVHCKTQEEVKKLAELTNLPSYYANDDYWDIYDDGGYFRLFKTYGYEWGYSSINRYKDRFDIIEFSDLIIDENKEEMSASEFIDILSDICSSNNGCNCCELFVPNDNYNNDCKFLCNFTQMKNNKDEIIDICNKWKSRHKEE